MIRLVLLFIVILSPCQSLFDLAANVDNSDVVSGNVLRETFNSPECSNPCWLGIEVGVSDREFVVDVLEQNNINYVANGDYTYNLYLEGNPSPLWRDMSEPLGDIHVFDDVAFPLSFSLNLCPRTIVETYGIPEVADNETSLELIYPDYGMSFWLDIETGRVRSVILYTLDYIDKNIPFSERQSWENFSDILFDDYCTDALSQ